MKTCLKRENSQLQNVLTIDVDNICMFFFVDTDTMIIRIMFFFLCNNEMSRQKVSPKLTIFSTIKRFKTSNAYPGLEMDQSAHTPLSNVFLKC